MGEKKPQYVIPLVVVAREAINENETPTQVALFNPDGTPFDFPDGGGTPENLEEHIADHEPHMAAVSGLNFAQLYAAGRV